MKATSVRDPSWIVAACVAVAAVSGHAAETQRPNVLLMLSDDHSYPFLSCYGSPNVRTPALDALAAEGMRFHRFYTNAPQCVPSRTAYLTGRSPVAARMGRFTSPLPRDEVTFPEIMRKDGYFVGTGGRSYHLDAQPKSPVFRELYEEHQLKTFADRFDFVQTGIVTGRERAHEPLQEFLSRKPADKPFFFWMNFSDPHHAWDAPPELTPDPESLVLPGHFPDLPGTRKQFAAYCGEINRLDRDVSSVLAELARQGYADNTIVIFGGDNGAALFRGKGSLYEMGCHVPLMIRWPGVVKPGSESHDLIAGEDLGPTMLEAVGLERGPRMSGHSFCSLLKGESFSPRTHVFTQRVIHGDAHVTHGMSSGPYDLARAVTTRKYRLIYNALPWVPYGPVDISGGTAWQETLAAHAQGKLPGEIDRAYFTVPRPVYELFDLEADPAELHNLSGQPEMAETELSLRTELAKRMVLEFDFLPLPDLNLSPGQQRPPRSGKRKANAN